MVHPFMCSWLTCTKGSIGLDIEGGALSRRLEVICRRCCSGEGGWVTVPYPVGHARVVAGMVPLRLANADHLKGPTQCRLTGAGFKCPRGDRRRWLAVSLSLLCPPGVSISEARKRRRRNSRTALRLRKARPDARAPIQSAGEHSLDEDIEPAAKGGPVGRVGSSYSHL
jgi:hypothetical protein